MRWQRLFADLVAQLDEAERGERDLEIADRTRRELASVRLMDRFRAAVGSAVDLRLAGGARAEGAVRVVGATWLLLTDGTAEIVVPAAAIVAAGGLGRSATAPAVDGRLDARLGLSHALRGLMRDRAEVAARLVDGSTVWGTVDSVGADFVEIGVHPPGEPRAATGARGPAGVCLPFAAVSMLRRV
jgi:hypothetical protein